jgi:hypothetical protein
MPEVTDLMRVAQYVKSDRDAPSDVYNAACRMLDGPDEAERLRAELVGAHDIAGWAEAERDALKATIERVKAFAVELRTYCSPAGIAAVYADSLEALLPTPAASETETS